jgi:hypothetical protein
VVSIIFALSAGMVEAPPLFGVGEITVDDGVAVAVGLAVRIVVDVAELVGVGDGVSTKIGVSVRLKPGDSITGSAVWSTGLIAGDNICRRKFVHWVPNMNAITVTKNITERASPVSRMLSKALLFDKFVVLILFHCLACIRPSHFPF